MCSGASSTAVICLLAIATIVFTFNVQNGKGMLLWHYGVFHAAQKPFGVGTGTKYSSAKGYGRRPRGSVVAALVAEHETPLAAPPTRRPAGPRAEVSRRTSTALVTRRLRNGRVLRPAASLEASNASRLPQGSRPKPPVDQWKELLCLTVAQTAPTLSAAAVSAQLSSLAQLAANDRAFRDLLLSGSQCTVVAALLGRAAEPDVLAAMTARDTATALWALVKLRATDEVPLLRGLCDRLAEAGSLAALAPPEVSKVLWSLAALPRPPAALAEAVVAHILASGCVDAFNGRSVGTVAWAAAALGVADRRLLGALAQRTLDSPPLLRSFDLHAVTDLAWAFAKLDQPHPALFGVLADHVMDMQLLDDARAAAISNLLWSFATLRFEHPALLEHVAQLCVTPAFRRALAPGPLATLVWAFATLRVYRPPMLTALGRRVRQPSFLREANSQDLAMLVWSLGRVGYLDPELMLAIGRRVMRPAVVGLFTAHELGMLTTGLAALGLRWPPLLAMVSLQAAQRPVLAGATGSDLATMLSAFASLRLASSSTLRVFRERLLTGRALLPQLSLPNLARVAWAYLTLRWVDAELMTAVAEAALKCDWEEEEAPKYLAMLLWVFTRAAPTTGRGLALQLSSHLVNHSLLPRLGSDDLVTVLWASVKLRIRGEVVPEVLRLLEREVAGLSHRGVALTLWCAARRRLRAAPLLQGLAGRVRQAGFLEGCLPLDVELITRATVRLPVPRGKILALVAAHLSQRRFLQDFGGLSLLRVARAFARAKVRHDDLMAAIATQAVAQDFAGLKLPQLAYLCGCYGALRVPAAELFDAVAERVAPLLARWPIQTVSMLTWSFARLRVRQPSLVEALGALVATSTACLDEPRSLLTLLWYFAQVGYRNESVLTALDLQMAEAGLVASASGRDLASLTWGFAVLNFRPPVTQPLIHARLLSDRGWHAWQDASVARMVCALARAGPPQPPAVLRLIADAVPRLLPAAPPAAVARLAAAVADLDVPLDAEAEALLLGRAAAAVPALAARELAMVSWGLARRRRWDGAVVDAVVTRVVADGFVDTLGPSSTVRLAWALAKLLGMAPSPAAQDALRRAVRAVARRAEAPERLRRMSAGDLATLAWAVARAGIHNAAALRSVAQALVDGELLTAASPGQLATVAWAYGHAGVLHPPLMAALAAELGRPDRTVPVPAAVTLRLAALALGLPAEGPAAAVLRQAVARGGPAAGAPVALLMPAVCAMAREGVADTAVLDLLAEALAVRPGEFNGHSTAALAWAIGALRPDHDPIRQRLAVALSQPDLLPQLNARDVVLVAWAVARLWPDDPSLTALVLRRAEAGDVLAALSGRDAAMLAASLAALAPASHAALVALRDTVLREGLAVGFTARDVATMAWAYASAGVECAELLQQLAAAAVHRGLYRQATPRQTALTLSAFARAGLWPPALVAAVVQHLSAADLAAFAARDLAALLGAYAKAGARPDALAQRLAERLASPQTLAACTAPDVATAAWACARLRGPCRRPLPGLAARAAELGPQAFTPAEQSLLQSIFQPKTPTRRSASKAGPSDPQVV